MKFWKKIMWPVSLLLIFGVSYLLLNQFNKETTYVIQQVDENGALLKPQTYRSGHVWRNVNYKTNISGYQLTNTSEKLPQRFGFTNETVKLTYQVKNKQQAKNQVKNAKYLGAGYAILTANTVDGFQQDDPNGRINNLRLATSNDGVNWKMVSANYPENYVRDPTPIRIKNKLVVLYTGGILTTTDLNKWTNTAYDFDNSRLKLQYVVSPDMFYDANESLNIVFAATPLNKTNSHLYVTSFSKKRINTGKQVHKITGLKMAASLSDPHIEYNNGNYYLWALNTKNQHLEYYKSTQPYSGYRKLKSVNSLAVNMLGPSVLKVKNQYRLTFNMLNSAEATVSVPYTIKVNNLNKMKVTAKHMQGLEIPTQINSIGYEPQK
ncbi:hypothetical protein [Lactiplantibacillus fabifermentans]|uniref:hypothetical protein n=1 Tax=Lactiplantibacillus fabifermentans TaxID=483011 RepID=UPI0012DE77B6|nr:hypothetical protein [Lactiplantibacillus fabifermentans]